MAKNRNCLDSYVAENRNRLGAKKSYNWILARCAMLDNFIAAIVQLWVMIEVSEIFFLKLLFGKEAKLTSQTRPQITPLIILWVILFLVCRFLLLFWINLINFHNLET